MTTRIRHVQGKRLGTGAKVIGARLRDEDESLYDRVVRLLVFAGIFGVAAAVLSVVLWSRGLNEQEVVNVVRRMPYVVTPKNVKVLPHKNDCYTQGLFIDQDGSLIESCGHYGQSYVRRVDADSGDIILAGGIIDHEYFAEGIERVGDKYVMLTWREQVILEIDPETLKVITTHPYASQTNQGWGISSNGSILAITDGSEVLHTFDPITLKEIKRIKVKDPRNKNSVVAGLNEIEFINDNELLANIYGHDVIARIDLRSGDIIGYINIERKVLQEFGGDFSGYTPEAEVMNGIAFDKTNDEIILTGKYWKNMYRFSLKDFETVIE